MRGSWFACNAHLVLLPMFGLRKSGLPLIGPQFGKFLETSVFDRNSCLLQQCQSFGHFGSPFKHRKANFLPFSDGEAEVWCPLLRTCCDSRKFVIVSSFELFQLTHRCEVSDVMVNRKIYNGIFSETDNDGF